MLRRISHRSRPDVIDRAVAKAPEESGWGARTRYRITPPSVSCIVVVAPVPCHDDGFVG